MFFTHFELSYLTSYNILLKCYGKHEDELAFFTSYLNEQQQCCNVNNVLSSKRKITCGVPQGSILDPLLCIIYMNDLPASVTRVDIKMYADDTSLFRAFKTSNQNLLAFSRVYEWLKCNKLSLNTVKTKFMIMVTDQKSKVVKYLGLMVDDCLNWEHHIEYITKK